MESHSYDGGPEMTNSALLIIDVQQSFEHKDFWQQHDLPAFSAALNQLINGCKLRGVALVDVFHVAPEGPFHWLLAMLNRCRWFPIRRMLPCKSGYITR